MQLVSSNIELKDLRFHACHGVTDEEQKIGSDFRVQLRVFFTPLVKAFENDELIGTVNYAEVYEIVRAEMQRPSKLIENVAWRISKTLFEHFKMISVVEISVEKENPPLPADCKSASVTLKLRRENKDSKKNT
ncbi:MAG: dihydroneopterin aldolase [Bacteroidaceae bacterium]|jgi:dihydroneopterin aldolase|nr:dihydroneopterin aldolase [Bacteroidaceae bacterium]